MMRPHPAVVGCLQAAALGVVLVLSGCSANAPAATNPPLPSAAPTATGTFNATLAYQSSWHIEARSTYVNGSADVCDLNVPISIEDAAALANPNTNVPVFGFVARDGKFTYGTVWPTSEPGTGITGGTGSYSISYDASGLPTTGTGTAKLSWHDKTKKPATSTRTDRITLTFTKEPLADHCQQ
jgi:hypothetical protein